MTMTCLSEFGSGLAWAKCEAKLGSSKEPLDSVSLAAKGGEHLVIDSVDYR